MLVSLYDAYLGSLIECLLVEKTQLLTLSERTVTVGELLEFDDLGAVKRHLVEKEVESVLRQSHTEQFDWLERKFDIKLRQDLPAWPKFIELTERRNLFVHTGGRVSSQYLKVCKKHGVDCSGVQQAERLKVTPAYFREGYRTILEIGVKLSQVLWRKLYPEERGQADQQLSDISFMLLTEERYVLARTLLDFSTQVVKKHSSADARLRFVINRAQAYKWSGDGKRALEILNDEDLSAVSDEFKLAAAVLREDFTIAIALVRKLGLHGKVDLSGYREWPLFKEARERSDFQAVVAEVFGEPLCQTAVQVQSSIEPPSSKDPAEEESPVPIEGQGH
jgi:hypothetical protein